WGASLPKPIRMPCSHFLSSPLWVFDRKGAARARCDRRHKIPLFGCLFNVRFTPESRHPAVRSECPISPNSGHYPKIASIFTLSYEVKPAEKGYEQTSADWHALRSQI
ncbi:MAG: hypothetical protein WBX35_24515, partial [Pseudolabrys sp.]